MVAASSLSTVHGARLDVIEEHAEEVAFLWYLRRRAAASPAHGLAYLAVLEDRMKAHLDGLLVAGGDGWVCCESLMADGPGEMFTATFVACHNRAEARLADVYGALVDAPECLDGIADALGWLAPAETEVQLRWLLQAEEPVLRRAALAALAGRRMDPGIVLQQALNDPEPQVVARALQAIGELGRREMLPLLTRFEACSNADCRFWGLWARALLGDNTALPLLMALVEADSPFAVPATTIIVRCLEIPAAVRWLKSLGQQPARDRLLAGAAGASGAVGLVPWLLMEMGNPDYARVAGDAFSLITGADLEAEGLILAAADVPVQDDTEDDTDDDDLPWPDPRAVRNWWEQRRGGFAMDTRYLCGRPVTREGLRDMMIRCPQRVRAAAAVELALMNPGRMLFATSAPVPLQRRWLGLR